MMYASLSGVGYVFCRCENALHGFVLNIEPLYCFRIVFSARQHVAYLLSALYAIARPSVCPSHGWIIQKTVEVRIMKFSPYSSSIPLVFAR